MSLYGSDEWFLTLAAHYIVVSFLISSIFSRFFRETTIARSIVFSPFHYSLSTFPRPVFSRFHYSLSSTRLAVFFSFITHCPPHHFPQFFSLFHYSLSSTAFTRMSNNETTQILIFTCSKGVNTSTGEYFQLSYTHTNSHPYHVTNVVQYTSCIIIRWTDTLSFASFPVLWIFMPGMSSMPHDHHRVVQHVPSSRNYAPWPPLGSLTHAPSCRNNTPSLFFLTHCNI